MSTNPRVNEIRYQLIRRRDARLKLEQIEIALRDAIESASLTERWTAYDAYEAFVAEESARTAAR